jgi:ATP-binding cassette subfamily F protein 3
MLAGLQNVTFEFGARTILRDATWHIQPNERIGLIGFNGTGKSTLLKLLTGQYAPSSGTVEKSRGTTIGYLHQDLLSFETSETILEVAMGAFEKVRSLEKEIAELADQAERTGDEELLNKYADKLHDFEVLGGYTIEHRTEEVLHGLGFTEPDMKRAYREFSGGWRMRVLLAKMILQQPDLLLLDEPTNHLDLPSIEWLEKYLQHYEGAVVIVSHDKYFLDRMVKEIVELYQQELHFYSGNYSFYEQEKVVRMELQQRAYENQQDYIRQQERFIERFKAKASKAAQAQSIMKRLDRLERVEEASIERPSIRINFQIDKIPGKIINTLKNASKSYGPIRIIENASAEIDRGDKIALIGANGKGKSTLLRIIAGTEPCEGERIAGHNVVQSFYAQHQLESLRLDNNLIEELQAAGSQKTDLELRTLLGCFLFSGDDADKRIRVLSGGEKARVALAKTIISKANFLLLDEPTNHLDLHSVELLIEALNKYEGSLILVSHDRYFISKTANKIWEIEDGLIKEFKGGYDEYVEWKERMAKQASKIQTTEGKLSSGDKKQKSPSNTQRSDKQQPSSGIQNPATPSKPDSQPTLSKAPIDKDKQKEEKRLRKQFSDLEASMAQLQQQRSEAEASLASPEVYADKFKFAAAERNYQDFNARLKQAEKEYEKIFEALMKFGG